MIAALHGKPLVSSVDVTGVLGGVTLQLTGGSVGATSAAVMVASAIVAAARIAAQSREEKLRMINAPIRSSFLPREARECGRMDLAVPP